MAHRVRPVRKAIFPVAGLGTRFLPATKALPKEMLPVVDKPLIEYAVDEARAAGIEELVFVTGRRKGAIEDHFGDASDLEQELEARGDLAGRDAVRAATPDHAVMSFVRQREPLGLGHAVWCARHHVQDEPFAVLLADDLIRTRRPLLAEMIAMYEDTGKSIVALEEVAPEATARYGIARPGQAAGGRIEVVDFVEKPEPHEAPSNLAIVGRYILRPEIMEPLSKQTRGANDEIQLTDAMAQLAATDGFWGTIIDGTRFDCGTKIGYVEANVAVALERDDLGPDVAPRLQALLERSKEDRKSP